ncbi:class I glutamine amidotransferase-like protein [Pseudovirgaria hyperparasitica]|uniref:Class I glutamine amidotransferase-like protein n=1 Tax=Pseudovirgaria hyperparasitica TaxID=470096 RepID=A0A6A6VY19_9PEZI|nr:class I glutamine amidotransferase-like protein [Pseudovirgaria hyperparasitica]KAF2754594.1 class I glutamine amidotransferase-like protein [Pseudovirgaria hyperparasitica]
MQKPIRIAVLECDTPLDKIKARHGGYGNIFERLLKVAATEMHTPDFVNADDLHVTKFHVQEKMEYPNIEDIDAILITGSRFNSFDNDPWITKLVQFTQDILAQTRVRIIGVCFGHQIVGRALGVKVDRSNAGWETSVLPMTLTPKGKELFKKDIINIHQMHRDIVYAYPPGVEALGHSPRCDVQGMYAQNRLLTVQGHPEFTQEIMEELCETRHAQKIFDDELYADSMRRVADAQDGVVVAQAFLRFLVEG